ncbi:hypothetical protein N7470_005147 [Penicillium chermesinum]|nr:hypothetical protein N7470_005147 [Penicillium chermesinum]
MFKFGLTKKPPSPQLEQVPASNASFSLEIQVGEMNAVLVALGWLNDRDLYRVCADKSSLGEDLFKMALEHIDKWGEGGFKAKSKYGILTDVEKKHARREKES